MLLSASIQEGMPTEKRTNWNNFSPFSSLIGGFIVQHVRTPHKQEILSRVRVQNMNF